MIKRYDFQENTVDWLVEKSLSNSSKQTFVIKAPTGAGKTIILIKYIDKYLSNVDCKTAFIWLCPGKGELEEQSKKKMEAFFPSRTTNDLSEALISGFCGGVTTFINWEKITKKGNRAISDGEKKNLFERIMQAHKSGLKFILIIDEEHYNNTSKARDIIDFFCAEHIIRVSATTIANMDVEYYEIDEQEVIDEGLITSAISVNEGIEEGVAEDDIFLLELANKKRIEILKEYKSIGKKINPLVLIQFPNGNQDKIDNVEAKLDSMGYTRKNKMVAAWLSGDKKDLPEDLTANDSILSFLFIKQAINTGWDCPRAKILVKLREGSDEAFEIQTIGRIRRMPEQKHYENNLLDFCYVYTFDKKFRTELLAGLDKAYIPKRLFLKENPRKLELVKELRDKDGGTVDIRNVYKIVREHFIKTYKLTGDKMLNEQKLASTYKFDDVLLGEVVQGVFVITDTVGGANTVITRTPVDTHAHGQLMRHTIDTFKNILGVEAKTIRQILDKLFCFKYSNKDKLLSLGFKEYYAFVINNASALREEFRIIASQVNVQNRVLEAKKARFVIPLEELYHFDPMERNHKMFERNAYKEYTKQYVTANCGRSTSEILFEEYCEGNEKVDWIYKNGDTGQDYLSIVYTNYVTNKQKLFYPDYIVKMKDGSIWIIETKGGQTGKNNNNVDKQVYNKFETIKRYSDVQDLNWGFVRNMSHDLYINNTEYVDSLYDERWKPIEEVL